MHYDVIDADGHVLEPPSLWLDYIDPTFRDRAPVLATEPDGTERLFLEGAPVGGPKNFTGSIGARTGAAPLTATYTDGRPGGFDPHLRVIDMDVDGIDAAILYPSLGNTLGWIKEPNLAAASCRAYNRWIVDYCEPYPERLFGAALIPMQSVELAIEELRFAREHFGLCVAIIRPNPIDGRMPGDAALDRLWEVAQELDVSIGVHEGTAGLPALGVDRFPDDVAARHMTSHTLEMMLCALSLIWGGTCDRFPRLRFAFLESGGGWMAPWLDRMDRHFDDRYFAKDCTLRLRPSEYFARQCWISFEPVETSFAYAVERLGADRMLWATDYPHPDGFFPGAPAMVAERVPEPARHQVLAGGALGFLGRA